VQILGEALVPLLISALQTGYRCFELTEDPHALATLAASLSAAVRTGGGRVAARARDAEQLAYRFHLGPSERSAVRLAAMLHDIGTVDLAEDLMHREGRLSAAELAQVREHPHFGAAIVQQLPGLDAVAPLVLHHHEHWDGSGYPHGLKAGAIPLGARIVAVVDAFHAMTSPRNNRLPRTPAAALTELDACAGSQFDRRVVEEFVRLAGETEAGGA
jgi:HD-GYP domain-containing protein (c-di-GMP phosphodiesterase class II)